MALSPSSTPCIDETKGPDARVSAEADIFANYGGGMDPGRGLRRSVK